MTKPLINWSAIMNEFIKTQCSHVVHACNIAILSTESFNYEFTLH